VEIDIFGIGKDKLITSKKHVVSPGWLKNEVFSSFSEHMDFSGLQFL